MIENTEIRRARALARVLDTAVGVPGTRIRIGLDAILGLVPGAGDIVAGALSGYIVLVAVRRGAPAVIIGRMLANIGIDTLIGSVPVLGDIFDVAFKSNVMNVELLERYAAQPAAVETRSRLLGWLFIAFLALLLAAVGVLGFLGARLIWRLLTA
jgi:hypothetical protein